jgi:hypothetical protein
MQDPDEGSVYLAMADTKPSLLFEGTSSGNNHEIQIKNGMSVLAWQSKV